MLGDLDIYIFLNYFQQKTEKKERCSDIASMKDFRQFYKIWNMWYIVTDCCQKTGLKSWVFVLLDAIQP